MTQANEPELSSDGGGEGAVDNRSHSLREDPSGEWHPLVPPPPHMLASGLAAWTRTSHPGSPGAVWPQHTQPPTLPPDPRDMRPALRTPDTGPGTPHPPKPPHTPGTWPLRTDAAHPTPPKPQRHPLPGVHPRASPSSTRWPRSAAHFQPLGCSKTFPVPDTSWTPPNPQASNHQTPPHLWHQTSTSGSPAARISQTGPTCLQFQGA